MKKLREQRQGEEDNVISFEQPVLATSPKPPGKDWLRSLEFGTRFVCKQRSVPAVFLPWYGIASIQEHAILLGSDSQYQPGHLKFDWVDSAMFSKQYELVQILPDMKAMEEEGKPPD